MAITTDKMIPLDNSREQPGKISPLHPEIVDFLLNAFQGGGLPFKRRPTPGLDLVIDDLYRFVHKIEKPEHSHAMSEAARHWACTNSIDPRIDFTFRGELLRLSQVDNGAPSCWPVKDVAEALLKSADKCREELGDTLPVLNLNFKSEYQSTLTGAYSNAY